MYLPNLLIEMNAALRNYFDQQLEEVLEAMPRQVHDLLKQVPLYVEDYPSEKVMRQMSVRHRHHLCGLYTGIPLTERHIEQSGVLSDVIYVFREGVLASVTDAAGRIDERELRRQIRITVLHELGHHHGMDEDELRELGYG